MRESRPLCAATSGGGRLYCGVDPQHGCVLKRLGALPGKVANRQIGAAVAGEVARGAGEMVAGPGFQDVGREGAAVGLLQQDNGGQLELVSLGKLKSRKKANGGNVEIAIAIEI